MSSPSAAPTPPAEPLPPPPSAMARLARFTERFGHMMSRVVLTVLYVALVAPAGLVIALLGDPLRIKRWRGTSWSDWRERNDSIELARRQG